jgi:hypothetical protein
MTDYDRLERILQRLPISNCPKCNAPLIPDNVKADGNRHSMDDAPLPKVWLVCKVNNCAERLLNANPTDFVQSYDDVLKAFEDALNLK